MSIITLFFVLLGVAVCTAVLMRLVEWVDAVPEDTRRRAEHSAVPDLPCAELELERARLAA